MIKLSYSEKLARDIYTRTMEKLASLNREMEKTAAPAAPQGAFNFLKNTGKQLFNVGKNSAITFFRGLGKNQGFQQSAINSFNMTSRLGKPVINATKEGWRNLTPGDRNTLKGLGKATAYTAGAGAAALPVIGMANWLLDDRR